MRDKTLHRFMMSPANVQAFVADVHDIGRAVAPLVAESEGNALATALLMILGKTFDQMCDRGVDVTLYAQCRHDVYEIFRHLLPPEVLAILLADLAEQKTHVGGSR